MGAGQDDELTVIWLSALSCSRYAPGGATCLDGRDAAAEREDLQGLLLSQAYDGSGTRRRVHVVLADAGDNVKYADRVADLIAARRAAFGPRVVAIGGGDSRTVTQRAINMIDQARQSLGIDCDAGSRLGAQVAPVWDAVALAQTLLTDGTPKDLSQLSGTLRLAGKPGTGSDLLTVYHGRVSSGGIPITKLCVQHLAQGPRSSATCDTAFRVPPAPGSTS